MSQKSLRGLRILVVEDEPMIVMLIEDMLMDLGCTMVGPAFNSEMAFGLIQSQQPDAAILDLNLGGQRTTAVAEALHSRNIPFFLATGYGKAGVSGISCQQPVLTKPFTQSQLEEALQSLFVASERLPGTNA